MKARTVLGAPPAQAKKQELRAWAKAERDLARLTGAAELDAAVVAAIRGSAEYRAARRVGAYLPMRGEVDVSALFADDKRFAVPRTAAGSTRGLTFHLLAGATIERRAWGLREPAANAPMIEVSELDLLLIPGLLFDRAGYRLGFGKGYYDRALIRLEGAARRPALFGVSLARLVVAALPVEAHDVPLTHLVTEEGVTVIGG